MQISCGSVANLLITRQMPNRLQPAAAKEIKELRKTPKKIYKCVYIVYEKICGYRFKSTLLRELENGAPLVRPVRWLHCVSSVEISQLFETLALPV